jgi:hypothetical protein
VNPLLASLGKELTALRALPVGADSSSRCPDDTRALRGLRKSELTPLLGEPDYIEESHWTFFFTSPIPLGELGGGFPELSFWFDADGVVENVKCHYSR